MDVFYFAIKLYDWKLAAMQANLNARKLKIDFQTGPDVRGSKRVTECNPL